MSWEPNVSEVGLSKERFQMPPHNIISLGMEEVSGLLIYSGRFLMAVTRLLTWTQRWKTNGHEGA